MTCAACASGLERLVKKDERVKLVQVNFATETMYLEYDESLEFSSIEEKVKTLGFYIIEDKIKEYKSKDKLYEKYEKLSEKYDKVKLMEAKYEEAEKEINDLKKVLELNNTLSESSYMNATIITRNIGYWYNTVTIDKGEKGMVDLS